MIRPYVSAYSFLMIAGILISAYVWSRITAREGTHDRRLTLIYFWGLIGALAGAKFAFLIADGWFYRNDWLALLSGRTITGGLLGGYAGVEFGKRYLNYPHTTGDVFAIVVPIGLILGRIGCLLQGCCPGMICEPRWWTLTDASGSSRWPASVVELLFNAAFVVWAVTAARKNWFPGNRFHVYLISYGLFRFAHEFLRHDLHWFGPFTGYHLWALVMVAFGLARYKQRRAQLIPKPLPIRI